MRLFWDSLHDDVVKAYDAFKARVPDMDDIPLSKEEGAQRLAMLPDLDCRMDPSTAVLLVGLVQMACRHKMLKMDPRWEPARRTGRNFVQGVIHYIGHFDPALGRITELGWGEDLAWGTEGKEDYTDEDDGRRWGS